MTTWPFETKINRNVSCIVPSKLWLCWTKCRPELIIEKKSNDISSVPTRPISTKLHSIVSCEVLYQNRPTTQKWSTGAKNKIKVTTLKYHLLRTAGQISTKFQRNVPCIVLFQLTQASGLKAKTEKKMFGVNIFNSISITAVSLSVKSIIFPVGPVPNLLFFPLRRRKQYGLQC